MGSKLKILKISKTKKRHSLPFFSSRVSAGFPSPAEEHIDRNLDLHEYLVKHPAATFFVRVEGGSMVGAGINSGDLLVVDRSLDPADGKVVIAAVDGELTVKRLKKKKARFYLVAESEGYPEIEIQEDMETVVWGVVTNVIHQV